MSYSPGGAFAAGWSVVRGRYRVMLEASVLYAIAQVVIVILQQLSGTADDVFSLEQLLVQAATTLGVSIPAAGGFAWMGVAAQRPGPVAISNFFAGYRRWRTLIGVWFLEAGAAVAILGPALLLSAVLVTNWSLAGGFDSIRGGALGLGAFIAIWAAASMGAAWVSIRLVFAQIVCLDPDAGNLDALTCLSRSWSRTRGHAFSLYLTLLGVALAILLSTLLLGLGLLLLGLPLAAGVIGAAYEQLVAQPRARGASGLPDPGPFNPSTPPDLSI